jgi:hypothetical protein
MAVVLRETFDWLKPSLLRPANVQDFRQPDFFQPQLLKFQTDEFMEDFLAAASVPSSNAFKAAITVAPQSGKPLKLFQPGHGCFYLVCASLCCRLPGFPDRKVQASGGESVFFVLRKFINGAEYAWVGDDNKKGWQPLGGNPKDILQKEERLPLMITTGSDGRSLLFGYLPVASRETYAVPPTELALDTGPVDVRIEELEARFTTPLTRRNIPPEPLDTVLSAAQKVSAEQARDLSVYLLLELWEFFEVYLPDVAAALRDQPSASFSGEQAQAKAELMVFLQGQVLAGGLRLAAALGAVAQKRDALNQLGGQDMAQLGFDVNRYNLAGVPGIDDPNGLAKDLEEAVKKALPAELPPIELPKIETTPEVTYAVRCVYERPQCDPIVRVVSQPSLHFQLASFFDPDAPVRPVRIPLPTDVSLAGLRRFKKGVIFLISNSLQKKINRITGKEKELLKDSPSLAAEGDDLAFICSFSIQIIFIVAFFLLLMFVIILNFVFWWIAFFRICLPIPKKLLPG